MYKCKEVSTDFFSTAHSVFKANVELNVSPEQVFESFEDAEDWPKWALP
jgi:uncharacterized protein YndB with AHSA1/START domain